MTNKQTIDGVSRETIKHALNAVEYLALRADDIGASNIPLAEELRALLDAAPVPPQGEAQPVAWRYQSHSGGLWYLSSSEHNARTFQGNGEGGAVEPLYTRPDAGEVERLRAQLAEREALLSKWLNDFGRTHSGLQRLKDKTREALSTSAEPKPRGEVDGNSHAPKHQGEPVVCAHEWTDDGEFTLTCTKCGKTENHEPYGWVQTRGNAINHFTQEWDVVESWEDHGFEYKALFDHAEQPAPVAVALPEHKKLPDFTNLPMLHKKYEGWNACIDEVAKLNGLKT